MGHVYGQQDADLHDENGEHISTPPTASGLAVSLWERRIRRHLDAHAHDAAKKLRIATPRREGFANSVCTNCGEDIAHLPAGQGWVHGDGYKMCPPEHPESDEDTPTREYTFTISYRFTAENADQAWEMWAEWLTEPGNIEEHTR